MINKFFFFFHQKPTFGLWRTLFWALLLGGLPGCQKENQFDCFKSTGKTETHVRLLEPFSTIQIFDNFEVELVKDTAYFIELTAGDNLMANLETTVTDGSLTLQNINKCNWVRSHKREIKAVVHAPSFSRIIHDGINTVRTKTELEQDTIRLDVTDAGDFDVQLKSTKIYCTLYEYGNITLKGSASLLVFENFGVGKIYAQQLKAKQVWGNVFGQGDNHVFPIDFLATTFRNSGNVYYYNQPAETERQGSGSGQLIAQP